MGYDGIANSLGFGYVAEQTPVVPFSFLWCHHWVHLQTQKELLLTQTIVRTDKQDWCTLHDESITPLSRVYNILIIMTSRKAPFKFTKQFKYKTCMISSFTVWSISYLTLSYINLTHLNDFFFLLFTYGVKIHGVDGFPFMDLLHFFFACVNSFPPYFLIALFICIC